MSDTNTDPNSPEMAGCQQEHCSALPDSVGFWWWRMIYKTEWEMVQLKDFGDGHLTAYSINGDWGGSSLNVAPERFAGEWVKISPPNEKAQQPRERQ